MKKTILALIILFSVLVSGCKSTKTNDKTVKSKNDIFDTTWELEYISGSRIAFDGLYPEKKPYIVFTANKNKYSGDSSCNIYSGTFSKKENSIHFGDVIKTMVFCEGGGEETFFKMLGKTNKLAFDGDGKLLLLTDDIPIMRFKKIAKPKY